MSNPRFAAYVAKQHADSIGDPYYRYGYEHPVDDAWKESKTIDWRIVVGSWAMPAKENAQ